MSVASSNLSKPASTTQQEEFKPMLPQAKPTNLPELAAINTFLLCSTPQAWVDAALPQLNLILIDHALCEKKAASAAISLLHRYPEYEQLLDKMTQLAREELLHFKQVIQLLRQRGVAYRNLNPGRYAKELRQQLRTGKLEHLIDLLIIGALVEARSCERFAALLPGLEAQGETELAAYYTTLIKAEARHFEDYLSLARIYSDKPLEARINELLEVERQLIQSPDTLFRFHSGIPA